MYPNAFADLQIFVAAARAGGFRASGRITGISPASASDAVRRLEKNVGVRLFDRSTRKVALTAEGQLLLERCQEPLEEMAVLFDELGSVFGNLRGTLRLSAPRISGSVFLNRLIAEFAQTENKLRIEVDYTDRQVDLVSETYDAVIRAETVLRPSTYAVPVGPNLDMAIVAAPDYFQKHGKPSQIEDLMQRSCIGIMLDGAAEAMRWPMRDGAAARLIEPPMRVVVNDFRDAIEIARSGLGLLLVPACIVSREIGQGVLVEAFKGQVDPIGRCSINFLEKRHMPTRLRAFLDFAKVHAPKA